MRFATFVSFGALLAMSACGTDAGGKDSGTDADADTDADTDTDTGGDTGGGGPANPLSGFTLNVAYGVDVNGQIVGVIPYGSTDGAVQAPLLDMTELDGSNNVLCDILFTISNPTVTGWSPGDYLSWEVAQGDMVVAYDGCADFTTTTSYGYTLKDFILANAFKFSIGPIADYTMGFTSYFDVAYAQGGQLGGTYFTTANYFITYGFQVDENMNVLSSDGTNYDQIPAGDIPSGAGVATGYYQEIGFYEFGV